MIRGKDKCLKRRGSECIVIGERKWVDAGGRSEGEIESNGGG